MKAIWTAEKGGWINLLGLRGVFVVFFFFFPNISRTSDAPTCHLFGIVDYGFAAPSDYSHAHALR